MWVVEVRLILQVVSVGRPGATFPVMCMNNMKQYNQSKENNQFITFSSYTITLCRDT